MDWFYWILIGNLTFTILFVTREIRNFNKEVKFHPDPKYECFLQKKITFFESIELYIGTFFFFIPRVNLKSER